MAGPDEWGMAIGSASWPALVRAIDADQPVDLAAAANGWLAVATAAERQLATLERGHDQLAADWHSPAGEVYLTRLAETIARMRATAEVARHNWHVLMGAASALHDTQLDFAVVASAKLDDEERVVVGRAVLAGLDSAYQQAIADLRPLPAPDGSYSPAGPVPAGSFPAGTVVPVSSAERTGGPPPAWLAGRPGDGGAAGRAAWVPAPEPPVPGPVLSGGRWPPEPPVARGGAPDGAPPGDAGAGPDRAGPGWSESAGAVTGRRAAGVDPVAVSPVWAGPRAPESAPPVSGRLEPGRPAAASPPGLVAGGGPVGGTPRGGGPGGTPAGRDGSAGRDGPAGRGGPVGLGSPGVNLDGGPVPADARPGPPSPAGCRPPAVPTVIGEIPARQAHLARVTAYVDQRGNRIQIRRLRTPEPSG